MGLGVKQAFEHRGERSIAGAETVLDQEHNQERHP
jgi:hypothetical protein